MGPERKEPVLVCKGVAYMQLRLITSGAGRSPRRATWRPLLPHGSIAEKISATILATPNILKGEESVARSSNQKNPSLIIKKKSDEKIFCKCIR